MYSLSKKEIKGKDFFPKEGSKYPEDSYYPVAKMFDS
jgi:hypothetical protein